MVIINYNGQENIKEYIESENYKFEDFIDALEKKKDPLRHQCYEKSVSHSKEMRVHVLGEKPHERLERYRPNEPKEVYEYRLSIYEPYTKADSKKALNTISKIRNNSNYIIKHTTEPNAKIPEGQTLKDYTEKNYLNGKNLIDYIFGNVLKKDMYDPNGIIVIMPKEPTRDSTKLYEPIGYFYRSDQVLYYTDEYFMILTDEKSEVNNGMSLSKNGNVYKFLTKEGIYKISHVETKGTDRIYDVERLYSIKFNEMPCFFLGGEDCSDNQYVIFESFMSGVLPYWNRAVDLSNDLDGQYVLHMYLERVEMEYECKAEGCHYDSEKGYHGIVIDGECRRCKSCGGSGLITGRSPFGVTKVRDKDLGEPGADLQFPGVEYIDKNTDIVSKVDERIESLTYQGFAAICMDFLSSIGITESGESKKQDRGEFRDFLIQISDNLFDNIIYNYYKYINLWRYGLLLSDEELNENMPVIIKPTSFDTQTIMQAKEDMGTMKESGVSNTTLSYMELRLIDKQFSNDQEARNILQAITDCDPLVGKSSEDKMLELSNGGISEIDYILSSNIKPFILRAWEEKGDEFFNLKLSEKISILNKYAEEKKKEIGESEPITLTNDNGEEDNRDSRQGD